MADQLLYVYTCLFLEALIRFCRFSFDVLVERVKIKSEIPKHPIVAARLLTFPAVVVRPKDTERFFDPVTDEVLFDSGKSCLFRASEGKGGWFCVSPDSNAGLGWLLERLKFSPCLFIFGDAKSSDDLAVAASVCVDLHGCAQKVCSI